MNATTGLSKVIAGAPYATRDFNSLKPSDCTLRMFISSSQLVYHVAHRTTKRIYIVQPYQFSHIIDEEDYRQALRSIIEEDSFLRENYAERKIGIFSSSFTFIPAGFYNEIEARDYLSFNCPPGNEVMICTDLVENKKIRIAYSISPSTVKLFSDYFSEAEINHSLTGLINEILVRSAGEQSTKLYVYVQQESMQLIYAEKGALYFCNSFDYREPEDFVYHLLFVYKQLQLNPEKNELVVLGEVIKNSGLFNLIYKYIRYIGFGSRSNKWKWDPDYPLPANFYFNLFCI